MKVKEILKRLKAEGWYLKNTEGSHRHFVHPTINGKVTVAGRESLDIPPKTLKSIYAQAGWPWNAEEQ